MAHFAASLALAGRRRKLHFWREHILSSTEGVQFGPYFRHPDPDPGAVGRGPFSTSVVGRELPSRLFPRWRTTFAPRLLWAARQRRLAGTLAHFIAGHVGRPPGGYVRERVPSVEESQVEAHPHVAGPFWDPFSGLGPPFWL